MERLQTRLEGPILVAPRVIDDERGLFSEVYRRTAYAELGIAEEMVQENHSRSREGVLRGMHFQIGEGVSKVVRCARGAVLDVVVDLRRGSPTFGEWESFDLDEQNMHAIYCPIGFAHGFCVVSDLADVIYKQSDYYAPDRDRAIAYDDPDIGIEWPLPRERLIVSARDAQAPVLAEIAGSLPFHFVAA
jgi:dTDP-4-dehydrorhamnose 3,5-epimerase